jgi:hypothetical protein
MTAPTETANLVLRDADFHHAWVSWPFLIAANEDARPERGDV